MRARYDLQHKIANFQFFSWLVMAKALGATSVVIDARNPRFTKWGPEQIVQRARSILVPGAMLGGLPVEFGAGGVDLASHLLEDFAGWVRGGGQFTRLDSVQPPALARYTVTLRRQPRHPGRNSNEAAWRLFAQEIGARLIEDWNVQPIGLLERMALYAGAEMNFFVPNGPMHLCSLSRYPMLCFGCPSADGAFARIGVQPGEQLPWSLPNQRLVWEDDALPNLRRGFDAWRAAQDARAAA